VKPLPKVKTVKLVTPRPAKMIKATPTAGKISICATMQPAAASRGIVAGAPRIKPILKKTVCEVRAIVIIVYLCHFCWADRLSMPSTGVLGRGVAFEAYFKSRTNLHKNGDNSHKRALLPITNVTFFLYRLSVPSFNSRSGRMFNANNVLSSLGF